MFDFGLGSSELLLIAIVALIVIGPKDLPRLLRTMGQYMRKIQGMAREFQNHLNEAAKETGVDDMKKEVKGMTNFTVTADLDKQGSEIKKAIESSAPKPAKVEGKAPASPDAPKDPAKLENGKAQPLPGTPKEPARLESSKAAPEAAPNPADTATRKTEPKPKPNKPAAKTKAAPGAKATPGAAPGSRAAPKRSEARKPPAGQKASRAPEAVKS